MNRDDIFRMSHEAGLKTPWDLMEYQWKFAALVAAAEREACAKVCEKEQFELAQDVSGKNGLQHFDAGCRSCAEMIRARGEA